MDPEAADPIDRAVGARIRMRRRAVKVSQSALATTLGISFQQVQKYELASNRVSASMLVRIAQTLHCSVAELVGEGADDTRVEASAHDLLTPDAIKLLELFARIKPANLRRSVIDLATSLAAHHE